MITIIIIIIIIVIPTYYYYHYHQRKMLQHDVYLILPQRLKCGLEQILLFVLHCRTVQSLDMYRLHTG